MTSPTPRLSPLARTTHRQFPLDQIEQGHYVLQILGSLRFATNRHIERAVFRRLYPSEHQARHHTTRTLRRLFDSGYIKRTVVLAPAGRSGLPARQIVSSLSPAGARAIGLDPELLRRRAPKTGEVLSHDYWLVTLGAEAIGGCPEELRVVCWWDERVLRSRKHKGKLRLPGVPDAYLLVENRRTGKLFPTLVEFDLGTESAVGTTRDRLTITNKVTAYLDYIHHEFREDFELDAPVIVLWVTHTERRNESIRQAAGIARAKGRFWFAPLSMSLGKVSPKPNAEAHSEGSHGPFWTSIWQTAHEDGHRSLAARCEV